MTHTETIEQTREKANVVRIRQESILKALEGVIHHNDAVKDEYKLPESLIRQVWQAINLQRVNLAEAALGHKLQRIANLLCSMIVESGLCDKSFRATSQTMAASEVDRRS